jgi:hypothetical protein
VTTFRIDEVFDIAARGGLVVAGTYLGDEIMGVPRLSDRTTGHSITVLGLDHHTPRTRRTGQKIIVVDRADSAYAVVGREWVAR